MRESRGQDKETLLLVQGNVSTTFFCQNLKRKNVKRNINHLIFQDTYFVVITISLVIYQEQQQLTASKGCKNPCAQIHSRIDDHPTF